MRVLVVKADTGRNFEEYCGNFVKYISPERQARVGRMRSERDRITSVTAELTVRYVIISELGIPNDEIEFEYGEHGKPFLKEREDFCFSFSHAGEYVVFVSSDEPVGTDIENISRGNEKIARRYFQEDEYRSIYVEHSRSFAEIWTSKEAYVKYLGTGLSQGLDTFNVLDGSTGCSFRHFSVPGGYEAAVCMKSDRKINVEFTDAESIFSFFI